MPVMKNVKDFERNTFTLTTRLDAPVARVWQLWEDPRQLERWWGPPAFPATVVRHELWPGGTVDYYMTGPEGQKPRGFWRVSAVEAPHRLAFVDGFADEQGQPVDCLPTMDIQVTLDPVDDGQTLLSVETTFPSREDMDRVLEMGMEEGMGLALGQIDGLLAET